MMVVLMRQIFLKLDCAKIKKTFGWKPVWNVEKDHGEDRGVVRLLLKAGDIVECMERQIENSADRII